ncbi:hypothetical protein BJ170DRAFT_229526 [Xylariales sp. AK1849]|nr:hypothetical protein BJ170DRAFT_229526 [Xylariales sp. AK1849]
MCSADLFLGILAILFPPLPVWVKRGICSADSLINILLCMLAYLPGLLHAWYIIAKSPEDHDYRRVPQDSEGGRVTYVFVEGNPQQQRRQGQQGRQTQPKAQHQGGMNYGTAGSSTNGNAPSSSTAAQAGGSNGEHAPAPPTYAEAVKGDHKVQTQD